MASSESSDGLQMKPELMLELAQQTAESCWTP